MAIFFGLNEVKNTSAGLRRIPGRCLLGSGAGQRYFYITKAPVDFNGVCAELSFHLQMPRKPLPLFCSAAAGRALYTFLMNCACNLRHFPLGCGWPYSILYSQSSSFSGDPRGGHSIHMYTGRVPFSALNCLFPISVSKNRPPPAWFVNKRGACLIKTSPMLYCSLK